MNRSALATAVLALAAATLLSACSPAPAPSDPAATPADAPRTALGRTVDRAITEARKELATENIRIGEGFHINAGPVKARFPKVDTGLPRAEITPQGDLLIAGDRVEVTAEQRRDLLQYRAHVLAIAEVGMAMGVKGADLAGQAVGDALRSVFSGDGKQFEQRIEAQASELEDEALQLCAHMQPLYDTQQRLAASLSAFAPYATLTQEDVNECSSRKSHNQDRARIRGEIRDDIRSGIRGTIQATVPRTRPERTRDDPAREADQAGAQHTASTKPEPAP
ncbi:hypothetical protein BH23PSE2_BH23PSE2_01510 [soil metagenome]